MAFFKHWHLWARAGAALAVALAQCWAEPTRAQAQVDLEPLTYRLTQSTAALAVWTSPPSEKVYPGSPLPALEGDAAQVFAARNEFEPFVLSMIPAASGNFVVNFSGFGAGITTEIYQVRYVNITQPTDYAGKTGWTPDPLWPLENGANVAATAGENTSIWFSVYVPPSAPAGDYTAVATLGGVAIPVRLHVFNFSLPEETHVQSQMNFSYQTILQRYGVSGTGAQYWAMVEQIKQTMIDHRLTPTSALWPGGLTTNGASPFIQYDCGSASLTDPYGIWGFDQLAARYLDGDGLLSGQFTQPFNQGAGFPSFMMAGMRDNDASADQRPDSFCGLTRSASDWYTGNQPASAFNQKWFQYVAALQSYLNTRGLLDRAYYYIANEPQDQADYDAVAWYSRWLKQAAPGLKLMVSEEPKPEIYANPNYPGAKIDIWLAHLGIHFNPDVALERLSQHGEETWIYFLNSTYYPRLNPFTIDHPGIDAKLTGWLLWKYRLRGIAYYRFNDWSVNPWTAPRQNGQNGEAGMLYPPSQNNTNIAYGANGNRFAPSIRLELLRDGLEDYEYFYMLNAGAQPQAGMNNPADLVVDEIIGGTQTYNRDSEWVYHLRQVVGMRLGGEIDDLPLLEPSARHARAQGAPGDYYINFQDPAGQPSGEVTVDGHHYMKVGSDLYDEALGYGWFRSADVPAQNLYTHYDPWFEVEPAALLRSSVIDDWGRDHVFEFDLPNGLYDVTVGVGYRGGTRRHRIVIEGVRVIDGETTQSGALIREARVRVSDQRLTLVMGQYDETGHINFLNIEAGEPYTNMLYLPVLRR